jgi:metabolite-proton symporter
MSTQILFDESPAADVVGLPPSRILLASLVGTAIEFYDFYVYATAASLVFGTLFFPASSTSAQLLAAYGSFALAFLARPLGSVVFGHFGDRTGRKSTLVGSLLLMGGSTVAIGLLPTYETIGWAAPLLLCIMRFGQGFGLGGEWGGAALLAVENAPPGQRARYGMFPQLGAPVGFIAANGLFLLLGLTLTPAQFQSWGWRLPFLLSAVLVSLGLWIRLRLTETPLFKAVLAQGRPAQVPIVDLFRDHLRGTIVGLFGVVACFAIFYLTTAFALGYGTAVLGYDRRHLLGIQLGAILFLAVGIVWAGFWSDKRGPRRVLLIGGIGTILVGFLLAPMLGSGSLFLIWAFLSLAFVLMGLVYGPLGTWLPDLFPPQVRYTGISIAFNAGGILGGGIAPILAQTLAERGGLPLVGLYLSGCGLVSTIAFASWRRHRLT